MPKLNTYPLRGEFTEFSQLLGLIPGTGDEFETIRISRDAFVNLIKAEAITTKGDKGDNGKQVELFKTATHIVWRYVGDLEWITLVALIDLKGDAGTGLKNRGNWAAGEYQPGDYVFATGTSSPTSLWVLLGDVAYTSSMEPKDDTSHWAELAAPAGADGREVEMRVNAYNFEWRYVGESTWEILGPTNQFPTWKDKGNAAGETTINLLEGESQRVAVTAAASLAFSNWPPVGKLGNFLLELVNGKAFAFTFPATINWVKVDGTITNNFADLNQPLQTAGTDWILFWTRDAGATVWAKVVR